MLTFANARGQKMPKYANVICESPLTTGNKAAVKLNKEVV